jgi:Na+/H+-translocating membrane pyrophosphatase
MLLEFINSLNNFTPIVSTIASTSLTLTNNKINKFINIVLVIKFVLLCISILYLLYIYINKKQELKNDYIPDIITQLLLVNILLFITFFYLLYQFYKNPPKKIYV